MLRRYRVKAKDYENVLRWVQKHPPGAVDEKEDEKSAEPLQQSLALADDVFPKIIWAHKTRLRLKKVAHGKQVLLVQEKDSWKQLVHEGEIDTFLRDALLNSTSDVPLSRDAGYHIVQKRTVGISRRAFAKFIAKQAVLQITRDRVPKEEKVGRTLETRGSLEMDLIEAKGKDIGKYVHHPVSNFYWITLIDRLTGYLEIESSPNKEVKTIAPKLKKMLKRMAKALGTHIRNVRSDKGSEFKSETQDVMKVLKIRHRFVSSGNRVEQANKTWQKTWYRLMRLGRGDLRDLDSQAQAIFNNTISSVNGRTPLEALDVPDNVLNNHVRAYRERKRLPKYKRRPLQINDRVRYLIIQVVGKHNKALGYKSYRGKHWSMKTHPIVKITRNEFTADKYYVAGQKRFRDQLLFVPGVDNVTRQQVVQRHRRHKQGYQDQFGDLALGDPEGDHPS